MKTPKGDRVKTCAQLKFSFIYSLAILTPFPMWVFQSFGHWGA